MSRLEVEALTVALGHQPVVRGVSLTVAGGCLLGLIGPNGAGKSTLLRALAGLLPAGGRMVIDGQPLARLSRPARARTIAYLAQERDVHWPVTVRQLVALGRLPRGGAWSGADPAADAAAVAAALRRTGLEALAERPVTRLSGGERARALLARALAVEAPILLADEPIAALDPEHQLQVLGLLRRHAEAGAAVVVVLHDLSAAARFCHQLVLLDQGQVVAAGAPAAVLTPETLARHYRVSAVFAEHQGLRFPVPWQPLAEV